MSFKKNKLKCSEKESIIWNTLTSFKDRYSKAKKRNFLSWILLWIFGTLIISVIWVYAFSKIENFSLDLSFMDVFNITSLSSNDPSKEKINILLTWIWWWDHEWADLTDTIILASINTKMKTVSMLSIPRDLYVAYPSGWAWRINDLYWKGKKAFSESKAMTYLEDKVEEITWEKADYYFNIDFAWFIKFVDLLWWVQVNVPNDLVDTEYPDNNWWYETFKIKKWSHLLDWTTALKYARSRHSTNDFDRSLRQQLVIKAIKEKLLKLDYISSPSKIKALFYTLSSNMKTDMWIREMIAMAFLAKEIKNDHIFSFNLNTSCEDDSTCTTWWFLWTPNRDLFSGASVILPEWATPKAISTYDTIRKFANIVMNYPEVSLDKNEISIINSTKVSWLANRFALMLKKYGFNVPEKDSIWSTKDYTWKTEMYYKWDEKNKIWVSPDSKTLEALSQFILCDQKPLDSLKFSKSPWAQIEIVLGTDYKLFLNN